MHILIIGAGSIGCLFGAFLAQTNNEVVLIEKRRDIVDAIREKGIGLLKLNEANPDMVSYVKVGVTSEPGSISACDLVIMAVKSADTLSAIKSVAHLINHDCPVLSIQTGLGNIEAMELVVARENILAGFTLMSGAALGGNNVRHGGSGLTAIGELNGEVSARVERIAKVFEEAGLETEISANIISKLWQKVIVYSAVNSVSAILKVRNGQLLENLESVTLMKRLIDEAAGLAAFCAVDLSGANLYDMLFDVCRKTSTTISSMLQDILNGHPTEIDAQNGYFCKIARERHRNLPVHETIVELIRLFEKLPGSVC